MRSRELTGWRIRPPESEVAVGADDDTVIAVEVHEPATPADLTVVLSHGYTVDARSWLLLVPELLAAGVRVVTWHQRGHGRSQPGPWGHYTIEQTGSDLARVIEAVAPDGPLVLIGHSMGAMSMMALAERDPQLWTERVRGAALISTTAGGLTHRIQGVHRHLAAAAAFGYTRAPQLVGFIGDGKGGVRALLRGPALRRIVRARAFGIGASRDGVSLTTVMFRGVPLSVLASLGPQIARVDRFAALPTIAAVPELLVLNGAADVVTPPEHSERLVAALPCARHIVIDGAGHFLMLEAAEVVHEEVLALIARVRHSGHVHDDVTVELPMADDTRAFGVRLGRLLRAGDVLVLSGDLGAGKTTMTQGIAEGLGVRGPITSPTFVISRIHPSLADGPGLVHVDAYRLGDAAELDDIDLDASLEESVTVVEWGTGLAESLADDRLEITVSRALGGGVGEDLGDSDPRLLTLRAVGDRWTQGEGAAALAELAHVSGSGRSARGREHPDASPTNL